MHQIKKSVLILLKKNTAMSQKTETKVLQKVNLVDGTFTPMEALDVLRGLIDEKINFHKLQRLTITEREHYGDTNFPDGRIKELIEEKANAKEIVLEAYEKGYQVKINGTLHIEFVK